MTPTLCIVSGPSSVGKSEFISSPWASDVTGLRGEPAVLFPAKVRRGVQVEKDTYLHYNILRPAHRNHKRGLDPGEMSYDRDPRWRRALRIPATKRAVVLVADRESLIERVRRRLVVEPGKDATYRAEVWLSLYESLDLDRVYELWRDELDRRGIPYVELDATAPDFPLLSQADRRNRVLSR